MIMGCHMVISWSLGFSVVHGWASPRNSEANGTKQVNVQIPSVTFKYLVNQELNENY